MNTNVRPKKRRHPDACFHCGVRVPSGAGITQGEYRTCANADCQEAARVAAFEPAPPATAPVPPVPQPNPVSIPQKEDSMPNVPAAAAVAAAPTPAGPPTKLSSLIKRIPLGELKESAANPRRAWDEEDLKGLADSIRAQGILLPLMVREIPNGKGASYEIIAGSRRFRAAKMAGLDHVPCLVNDMTDGQALQAALVENLQRTDLSCLEEAEGYKALIDTAKYDVKKVASSIGRSIGYVYARLKILEAVGPVKDALAKGEIEAAHAVLLARLEPAVQKDLVRGVVNRGTSVHDLARQIQQSVHKHLSGAPWKWEDAELLPEAGACIACPHRSNKDLHPDLKADTCLKPSCYERKLLAFAAQRAREVAAEVKEKAEAKIPAVTAGSSAKKTSIEKAKAPAPPAPANVTAIKLSFEHRPNPKWEKKPQPNTLYSGEWAKAEKADRCEFLKLGVVVVDPYYNPPQGYRDGQILEVCSNPEKCETHKPRRQAAIKAKRTPAQIEKARKENARLSLQKVVRLETFEQLKAHVIRAADGGKIDAIREDLLKVTLGFFGRLWHDHKKPFFARHGWEPKKKTGYGGLDFDSVFEEKIRKLPAQWLIAMLIEIDLTGEIDDKPFRGVDELLEAAKRWKINPKNVERGILASRKEVEKAKDALKDKAKAEAKAKVAKHQKKG